MFEIFQQVTIVTSQPGRQLVHQLEMGLKDADLVSLKRLLVVQICHAGDWGQDSPSPEAQDAVNTGWFSILYYSYLPAHHMTGRYYGRNQIQTNYSCWKQKSIDLDKTQQKVSSWVNINQTKNERLIYSFIIFTFLFLSLRSHVSAGAYPSNLMGEGRVHPG